MTKANRIRTTLFAMTLLGCLSLTSAAGKPVPPPGPVPTEPPARAWAAFGANGSEIAEASRLYLFGGSNGQALADFWYYSVGDARWTVAPTGTTKPGARVHVGFSCGAGRCVVANGERLGPFKETWIYTEGTRTWLQMNCNRFVCPAARRMPAMAYDPQRFQHVLFGGANEMNAALGDTFTLVGERWTAMNPTTRPPERLWAAAAYVPHASVRKVVMFGGYVERGSSPNFCDMWAWTGSNWQVIEQSNNLGPCLRGHSMVWDGTQLVVTGGYLDADDTPNYGVWTFRFAPGGTSGSWNYTEDLYRYYECDGYDVHNGARMAYDSPSGTAVFFGGVENINGAAVVYGNTTRCASP